MNMPFPGMITTLANQLQPRLDPRYVASIEERVFIEGPQRRIPHIRVQKTRDAQGAIAVADPEADVDNELRIGQPRDSNLRFDFAEQASHFIAAVETFEARRPPLDPGRWL